MLKRVLVSNPDVLTLLSSILFVIDYLFIIVYSLYDYKKDDAQYKIAVYAYAALLGIEILYSGKFMQGFGLGDLETLIQPLLFRFRDQVCGKSQRQKEGPCFNGCLCIGQIPG